MVKVLSDQTQRELVYSPFQFQKGSQLFIRTHNETLSIVAVCINNPDRTASSHAPSDYSEF